MKKAFAAVQYRCSPDLRYADIYLSALGYEKTGSFIIPIDDGQNHAYIYSEIKRGTEHHCCDNTFTRSLMKILRF